MLSFIHTITTFPTLFYTVLLGIVLFYWALVMLGLLDFEGLDTEIEMELDTDLDLESDASTPGGFAGLLASLGLNGVPLSLVCSLLILFSWLFSFFAARHIIPLFPGSMLQWIASAAVIVLSLTLAIPITVRIVRPMKGAFVVHHAIRNKSLVGQRCEIKSLEVNERTGQALLEDGGAGMLLSVWAKTPNSLSKGDCAMIIDYNESNEIYQVIPDSARD